MKHIFPIFILIMAVTIGVFAADCSIVGKWGFDMNGFPATVDYRQDGTLSQDMFGLSLTGTYTVKGNRLTTIVSGTTTVFTIVSCSPSIVTVRRDRDGLTVVYSKK
ncbi:MAG TPA: hypothetical protein PK307_16515 [Spirochaetota bacterium]|nr:hypothetical protein [Spirochaetota bacterium]HOD15596.1 hypothetical protein [Spirochaetota bacterium]HPG52340.1 hypothetical protein [Spirochaetota bacterium]HPN10987.1 hypothetical protein [Spirochaetota bacterium]HQL83804.1 hypothetical protein [Spirochaetota bacterium]